MILSTVSKMSKRTAIALSLSAVMATTVAADPSTSDHGALLAAVAKNEFRTDAERARDTHRNPEATLTFFGMKPDMTVVEVLPGGGWYTHIVAPYLKSGGKYIAANLHPDLYKSDEPSRRQRRFAWAGKFTADEEIFGKNASTAFFGGGNPTIDDESVDMVFAIRSFHGWVQRDLVDPVLADFFRMVKPGGTLAIVQHREFEASENEQNGRRGYLKESFVIDAAKRAGFELVARSEVNANPRDTKDHASGVWTLPPVLTNGDRVEYKLIGESDRMTLKFRKPTA